MPRASFLALLALLAAACLAPQARAAELYVVVEETAASGELLPLIVRTDQPSVVVHAWRLEEPGALREAGIRLDRGEALAWLDPRNEGVTPAQRRLRGATLPRPVLVGRPFSVPGGGAPHAIDLSLGGVGLHLIVVEAGRQVAYATALVSDLGIVTKRAAGGLLVWAVHRTTGVPIEGVSLKVGLGGQALMWASTKADGTALLEAGLPSTARIWAEWGGHLAIGETTWHPSASTERRVYVHAHQPAYRPGERVEIRGIVRAVEGGALRLDPSVSETRVTLLAPGDREMGSMPAAVSPDMGTFACSFDLPEDAPTGAWVVVADVAGKAYEAPLTVDAYRKPAFEVKVVGGARRMLIGEESAFEVRADWYDGGPLGGAPVQWQLLYQRLDRDLFPEDELVQLFFGTEREAYRPETLATGQGVLDAEGRLSVPVTAPLDRADGYLSLRATVQGPDRVAVAGSGRIGVSRHPVILALSTDRHLYGPEDVARVTIKVEGADGRPAPERTGLLTVGLAPEVPAGAPERETRLHNIPFATKVDGTAIVTAPLAGAGRYALRATILPTEGEPRDRAPAHATLHVWAAGERATPGHPGAGIRVIADRDAYAVGDEAKLLVLPGGGTRPILATLERGGVLQSGVLRPGEVPPVWTIPLSDRHVPNVFATFAMVDHGRLLTTTHVIRIPPRTRLLTTTVAPDLAEVEPGQASGFTVSVADHAGAPVAGAEVAVAVVDEALFALHADPSAPVEAFFHPPERNAVGTEDLLQWTSVGWARLAVTGDKAEGVAGTADPAAPAECPLPPAAVEPAPRPSAGGSAPASEAAPPPEPEASEEMVLDEESGDDGPEIQGMVFEHGLAEAKKGKSARAKAVRVREDFRTAIFWEPALRTDGEGRARVDELVYGDSLTRWRITAKSLDAATRVGTGEAWVRTRRKVSARLTLPRFLRAGDRVAFPVLFRNLTDGAVDGRFSVLVPGGPARIGQAVIAAGALHRVEVDFLSEVGGTFPFEARIDTDQGGDAERRELPVLPRGIEKVDGHVLHVSRGEDTLSFRVPEHAEAGTVSCRVRLEPAYASAMVGALPYLLDYPYGCTEQTLNRFVPLLAAAEAVAWLEVNPRGRATELPAMIEAGVARLARLQHADGGFGWWEEDGTDVGMTALVVRGLSRLLTVAPDHAQAKAIRAHAVEGMKRALGRREATLDATTKASVVLAAAAAGEIPSGLFLPAGDPGWRSQSPLGQALLLRAAVASGNQEVTAAIRGLLDDEARRDGDLLWWSPREAGDDSPTVRWQDDDVETTAVVLLALLEAGVRPEVLDGGTRWLLLQRRAGDRWRSTRDTAAAVTFLARLVRETGDLGAGRDMTLLLGDETVWEGALDAESAFTAAAVYDVPVASLVPGGDLTLRLRCPQGAASASIALRYHETGPAISPSAHGFQVTRRFYGLEPRQRDGGVVWRRTQVAETMPAGTLVECEVSVTAPAPREYVMITSPHAGAFEPAREIGMDVEGREPAREARTEGYDDRTMFFVARLPEGRSVFRHLLRATHAGSFTALPAQAELMYFPETRGNSAGELWQVTPTGPVGQDVREGGR